MFGNLSGPTLLVILFIVLLLFGAPKLPGLAKSLGQSMRILKKEVRSDDGESGTVKNDAAEPPAPAAPAAPAPPVPPAPPAPPVPPSTPSSDAGESGSGNPDKPQV